MGTAGNGFVIRDGVAEEETEIGAEVAEMEEGAGDEAEGAEGEGIDEGVGEFGIVMAVVIVTAARPFTGVVLLLEFFTSLGNVAEEFRRAEVGAFVGVPEDRFMTSLSLCKARIAFRGFEESAADSSPPGEA